MSQCKECGKKFARPSTLKRHMGSTHALLQAQFQCAECLEPFTRQDNLARHVLVYHKDGLKQCQHCSGKYRQDYIDRHELKCKRKSRPRKKIAVPEIDTSSRAKHARGASWDEETPKECWQGSAAFDNKPQGTDALSSGAMIGMRDGALSDLFEVARDTDNGHIESDADFVMLQCLNETTKNAQPTPTYDEMGRVRIYSLPFAPEDYPAPPSCFVKAIQDIAKFSPQLSVSPVMQPYYFHLDTAIACDYNLIGLGTELYMMPCIRCNDCHEDVTVSNPEDANRAFRAAHMFRPAHAQRLRERLIPNSETVRQAVSVITMGGQEALEYYITCLTAKTVSAGQLRVDYIRRRGESIFALALRNGEKEILQFLFEDSEIAEWDRIPKFVVQWAQVASETEAAKVLVYAAFENLLSREGHDTGTLVEKLIRNGHKTGALEVIKLTAWCFDEWPPNMACWFGQQKFISAILLDGSRSLLEWTCSVDAPKATSLSASAARMRVLLKAAAWLHQMKTLSPKDKSQRASTSPLGQPSGLDVRKDWFSSSFLFLV